MKKVFTLFLALVSVVAMANPVDMKTAESVAVNHYTFLAPDGIK